MDATVSRMMADRAAEAVTDAKAFDAALDYSVESIEEVERILGAVYDSKARGGLISRLLGRTLTADAAARLAQIYGSYIGECLIRKWGGYWEQDHPVAGTRSYPINCRGHQSFPLGWCYRRLTNGPEDNVWHKVLVIYLTDRERVEQPSSDAPRQ